MLKPPYYLRMSRTLRLGLLCTATVMASAPFASAAAITWTGGGADTNWNTAANWSSYPSLPASGADVTFASGGTTANLNATETVGLLTFNTPYNFTISDSNSSQLTLNTGITVAPSDSGSYTYGITSNVLAVPTGSNIVLNIASGSILNLNSGISFAYNPASVEITGGGTVNFTQQFQPGIYYANYAGTLNVNQGTFNTTGAFRSGGVIIGNGATLAPSASGFDLGLNYNGRGVSTINGTVGSATFATALGGQAGYSWGGAGTITIAGNGKFVNTNVLSNLMYSDLVLDDSAGNIGDRFNSTNAFYNLLEGGVKLVGNATSDTTEHVFSHATNNDVGGHVVLDVEHGANANATLSLSPLTFNLNAGNGSGGGILEIIGNDLLAPNATTGKSSTVAITNLSDTAGTVGFYAHMVDSSGNYAFATSNGSKIVPYSGSTFALAATTASTNAQVGGGNVVLAANATANSLRIIDGSSIDIGGHTLQIGGSTANGAGSVIQTGSNNTTGIFDGTLQAGTYNTTTPLLIMNDKDLTIGANVKASGIYKDGPGTLTLTGTLTFDGSNYFDPGIRWYEGSLVYSSATSTTIFQYTEGSGSLTVNGAGGTLTMDQAYVNSSSGGITVNNGGFLIVNGDGLGSGIATVNTGGHLELTGGSTYRAGVHTTIALVGGLMEFTTGSNNVPFATSAFGLKGTGTVQLDAGAAGQKFTQPGTWAPGGAGAGIITLKTNSGFNPSLDFAQDPSTLAFPKLIINITGSGDVAGIDYSQLAGANIAGANGVQITGLTNVDLVVDVTGDLALTGDTFTIVTSTTNFTSTHFRSITYNGTGDAGADETVSYNNGSIVLSNVTSQASTVPEPASLALLGLGAAALISRRRRR